MAQANGRAKKPKRTASGSINGSANGHVNGHMNGHADKQTALSPRSSARKPRRGVAGALTSIAARYVAIREPEAIRKFSAMALIIACFFL